MCMKTVIGWRRRFSRAVATSIRFSVIRNGRHLHRHVLRDLFVVVRMAVPAQEHPLWHRRHAQIAEYDGPTATAGTAPFQPVQLALAPANFLGLNPLTPLAFRTSDLWNSCLIVLL